MRIMMKRQISILLILLSALAIYAGAIVKNFEAESVNGNVVVRWETISETNVKHFSIERKTYSGGFVEIGIVNTKPEKVYEFVDQTAFKTDDILYIYRLKIVDNDGTVTYLEQQASVAHRVSSVKRTWGSIKALFR